MTLHEPSQGCGARRSSALGRARSALGVLGVLSASLAVASCSKPVPPTVTPRAISVASVSTTGLGLKLDLDVYNPNAFPLWVHTVEGTVDVSGVEFGRASAAPESSIAAKSTSAVSCQLAVAWTNLGALAPLAISSQAVDYRFRGSATLGSERLNVSVPFELAGALSRADLLRIGLTGLTPR